ncbi:MAG: DUF3048 domain-containing protein [Lachnospiraceae bacterium]|nr:DUF3048 domain-containing protein [Lachnospiraceae bacterium]
MKKSILIVALALVLWISACSILPEDSPIIQDGEEYEQSSKTSHKNKKNKTEETPEPTAPTESRTAEATPEPAKTPAPTPEPTPAPTPTREKDLLELEEEENQVTLAGDDTWVELPEGGEEDPITERETKLLQIDPKDAEAVAKYPEGEEVELMQSYLTGTWTDVNAVKRRNIAVMLPNVYRAGGSNNSPQLKLYGISKASIIYEAPVEGRNTALMAIFEDYDRLKKIGPVASSRDYFIYDAMSFDSIYVNWGMARIWTEELINSDRIDNLSATTAGIKDPAKEIFYTDENAIPDAGKDYVGYLDVAKLASTIEARGYEKEYRETFEQAFQFANDKLATYPDAKDVVKIWPGGKVQNAGGYGNFADKNPHFEYDAEKHLYYRYQFGDVMTDAMNGQKIGVTNVVLKLCHGEERMPDDARYDFLAFGVHGTGKAYVFTNGKMIEGTWEKSSDPGADYLYDEEGNEIVLNQGKTWICCVWQEFDEFIVIESPAN